MASSSSSPGGSAGASVQEYNIRVPKSTNKKFHVMRFTSERDVDFRKWTNVKMERENNMKEFKGIDEDQPKFGAGSEFGRDQREEARRKKFGIVTRRYKSEDQPWLLKVGGKMGKKFKGIREGGVSENAAYYVFTHAADGAIDAYPLQEWYNFQPIQRFKALSAEEAEEAYNRRNKTMNYFSLMMRKRLCPDAEENGEEGEEGKKGKKGAGKKDLTISELDEWMNSSDDSGSDEGDGEKNSDEDKKKAKAKKGAAAKKKKKKQASDDEAVEESDDGDEEGREHEYISDSSSSASEFEETKQLKGVAEEDALRKLLTSDEDSDEEKSGEKSDEAESGKEADDKEKGDDKDKKGASKKKKKKIKKKPIPTATKKKNSKRKDDMGSLIDNSSSELSSDSTDEDSKSKVKKEPASAGGSRAGTPTKVEGETSGLKRKAGEGSSGTSGPTTSPPPAKKSRTEGGGEGSMMEEAVRRYLARKPMTTTELLQKFKSKKTGMSSEQLVNVMTQILKKINPVKQTIKGKMYLSIKS